MHIIYKSVALQTNRWKNAEKKTEILCGNGSMRMHILTYVLMIFYSIPCNLLQYLYILCVCWDQNAAISKKKTLRLKLVFKAFVHTIQKN